MPLATGYGYWLPTMARVARVALDWLIDEDYIRIDANTFADSRCMFDLIHVVGKVCCCLLASTAVS